MRRFVFLLFLSFLVIKLQAQSRVFVNHNEVGVLSYGPIPQDLGYTFKTTNGFSFDDQYQVGISLGVDHFVADEDEKFWLLPLSAQFKYILHPQRKAALYGSVDAGYGFSFLNEEIDSPNEEVNYKGGFHLNPQVGLRLKKPNRKVFWTLALGYKMQQVSKERSFNNMGWLLGTDANSFERISQKNFDLHRVALTVGVGF